MNKTNQKKYLAGAALALLGFPAFAAQDYSSVGSSIAAEISAVLPVVSTLGVALLTVYVVVKAFQLIRSIIR